MALKLIAASNLIFVDLDVINNQNSEENYKESLKPFRQLYPSVEIIVMTRQEKIRKAVKAVKAGADDYLTYPFDAEELKLVSENLNKTRMMQSEIDYLRGQFWRVDTLEAEPYLTLWLKAKCPAMKKGLSRVLCAGNSASLNLPPAALFFWMNSAPSHPQPRSNCCRFCKTGPINGWEQMKF
jgi:DNA-binding NtrC family response regulator